MGGDGVLEPDAPWREALGGGGAERIRPAPPAREALRKLMGQPATFVARLTGADRSRRAGTDLGIPYLLENGSVGFLFGDTFATAWPEDQNGWRSPVMLRSNVHPSAPGGIVFDSAARVAGDGPAGQLMDYFHWPPGLLGNDPDREVTRIPNDAVSFPETGRQVLSYMSVYSWPEGLPWLTGCAGLAYSDNGNDFVDVPSATWSNDPRNRSPFQMWTMERDGAYVYVFSVRAGRQSGPMMLQRVPWQRILEPSAYEPWGWRAGSGWKWGQHCTPLFPEDKFLSRRCGGSATVVGDELLDARRSSPGAPSGRTGWSDPKEQVTWRQEPSLYGGFIHPYSTSALGDLHLMVSTWQKDANGKSRAYHVSQYAGTL
jgi:hypothetical protein